MNDKLARIGWIDEFKGFVLLLVCLFHVEQSFANVQMGMLHLAALRMSAFFFISGMLFSTRRFPDFRSYFIHKSKVLLFPYVALSLLFLALDPVLYHFEWFPRAPRMVIMNIRPVIDSVSDYIGWNLAKIFVVGKSSIGSGPLWFVFTLYSVSLLFYGVQKLARKFCKNENCQKILIALVAMISLAGGWILSRNHIRLPLGIERDLTTLFFFACGWLCKVPIQKWSNAKASFIPTIFVAIAAFVLYAFFEKPDPNFSIMNNDLGKNLVTFLTSSLFGIAGLMAAFLCLDKLPDKAPLQRFKGILRNISRNALVILAVHWWILLVLRIVFKAELDRPGIAYLSMLIVTAAVIGAIPLFRCRLYKLLGKTPVSIRESLDIRN